MNPPKLKIHADRSALTFNQPHAALLIPFWGKNPELPNAPDSGRFDDYQTHGSELFELTTLEKADVAILAGEWVAGGGTPQAYAYSERVRKAGKPLIIFFNNDSEEEIPVDRAIIFRTSTRRSRRTPKVYGLPAWSEDFVNVYRGGNLPTRAHQPKPVIGYCGYGAIRSFFLPLSVYNILSHVSALRSLANRYSGGWWAMDFRSKLLRQLELCQAIQTNFLLRTSFNNGVNINGVLDLPRARQSRLEYVNNLFDSDYVLCTRGAGNFSYRFYEVLCSGRIPLFIDTDCLLPHDAWINWRDYCVWVNENEARQVAEHLAAFHAGLSPAAFEELQHNCRRLWLEWLSPLGFFSQIHRYL